MPKSVITDPSSELKEHREYAAKLRNMAANSQPAERTNLELLANRIDEEAQRLEQQCSTVAIRAMVSQTAADALAVAS